MRFNRFSPFLLSSRVYIHSGTQSLMSMSNLALNEIHSLHALLHRQPPVQSVLPSSPSFEVSSKPCSKSFLAPPNVSKISFDVSAPFADIDVETLEEYSGNPMSFDALREEYDNFRDFYELQQEFVHTNEGIVEEDYYPLTKKGQEEYHTALTSNVYSETAYKQMARFAISAYCARGLTGKKLRDWTCKSCKETAKPTKVSTFRSKANIAGYVAHVPATNTIVVSFAGTDPISITNWMSDLDFQFVDYSRCGGCKVHRGFLLAYQSARDEVRSLVAAAKKQHPTAAVAITGHSLGGALATLALADFLADGIAVQTPSYVFGSPRVGNSLFSVYLRKLAKGSTPQFRGVHHKDPVPQLPLNKWGFEHPSQEIFFSSGEKSSKMCSATIGEDKTCSFITGIPWIVPNAIFHTTYGKMDMLGSYLDCKLA